MLLDNTIRYCLSCKVKDIDYKRLLKSIGNQDMGIEPSLKDEVFFINKNSHIIYQLYDDRGLDIEFLVYCSIFYKGLGEKSIPINTNH